MSGAPYEANGLMTDSETFEFSLSYDPLIDGAPIDWSDYELEYAISRDGVRVFGLSSGRGITIDPEQETLTFARAEASLRHGLHAHSCRLLHIASGTYIALFDGTVTVTRSAFP